MPTLLLHPRYDDDSQILWQEAVARSWAVVREGYEIPLCERPRYREVINDGLAIYGGHMWAHMISAQIGGRLDTPAPRWLAELPREFVGREIAACELGDVVVGQHPLRTIFPIFVKSLGWPQEFTSRVYASASDLPALDNTLPVLISEVMRFEREFRFFCVSNTPVAWSPYSRGQEGALDTQLTRRDKPLLQICADWLGEHLPTLGLPNAVVVDVGVPAFGERRAVIVEANPAWCSGIYRCNPTRVLDVIAECVHAY